jgi:spore maturation protein CgeB
MRIVWFYPSLLSDWRNPSASLLRGVAMELLLRGHEVVVYEPRQSPSLGRLLGEQGHGAVARFHAAYPGLASRRYDLEVLDLDYALKGASLVVVHEACHPHLVRRLGAHRKSGGHYQLLFHAVGGPGGDRIPPYDGLLAGSERVRLNGPTGRTIAWPGAADTRLFRPVAAGPAEADVVWIGDWDGDSDLPQLEALLLEPIRKLGLTARVIGAGYTPAARALLEGSGVGYLGWVPGFAMPEVYARFKAAIHYLSRSRAAEAGLSRRPYEALACATPMVCAQWDDPEGPLQPGLDFGLARDGVEMAGWLRGLLTNPVLSQTIVRHGRRTVLAQHTCARRADALLRFAHALARPQGQFVDWSIVQLMGVPREHLIQ